MSAKRAGLARLRRLAGYTQESLAAALRVDPSTVRRWEAGGQPAAWVQPRLAEVLEISRNELAALLHPEADVLAVAQQAVRSGSRLPMVRTVHSELLTQYESLTSTFRQIDYQAGSAAIYNETVVQLERLMSLADAVPSKLYQRFALALGDTAQLAAWLAIDHQDYVAARRYTSLALSSAQEGEDPELHAYVLGIMSYIHLHAGRGPDAVRLLLAAIRLAETARFGINEAVHSWLSEAIGEAYALSGEHQAGSAALAKAERLFDRVEPDDVPAWLGFFNGSEHVMRLKGRCLVRLGDGQAATAALHEAVDALPEHYVRERSGTLIDLATAQLMPTTAGKTSSCEPEAAAATALEAWNLAVQTGSGRNQGRIRELLPQFRPYRHLRAPRVLLDAVN